LLLFHLIFGQYSTFVYLIKCEEVMADNYLEKQSEEYQARKAAWEKERKLGIRKPIIPSVPKTEQPDKSTVKTGEKSD